MATLITATDIVTGQWTVKKKTKRRPSIDTESGFSGDFVHASALVP